MRAHSWDPRKHAALYANISHTSLSSFPLCLSIFYILLLVMFLSKIKIKKHISKRRSISSSSGTYYEFATTRTRNKKWANRTVLFKEIPFHVFVASGPNVFVCNGRKCALLNFPCAPFWGRSSSFLDTKFRFNEFCFSNTKKNHSSNFFFVTLRPHQPNVNVHKHWYSEFLYAFSFFPTASACCSPRFQHYYFFFGNECACIHIWISNKNVYQSFF